MLRVKHKLINLYDLKKIVNSKRFVQRLVSFKQCWTYCSRCNMVGFDAPSAL